MKCLVWSLIPVVETIVHIVGHVLTFTRFEPIVRIETVENSVTHRIITRRFPKSITSTEFANLDLVRLCSRTNPLTFPIEKGPFVRSCLPSRYTSSACLAFPIDLPRVIVSDAVYIYRH